MNILSTCPHANHKLNVDISFSTPDTLTGIGFVLRNEK